MIMRSTRLAALVAASLAFAACSNGPTPAAIDARIAPARLWYHPGQDVLLTGFVTDIAGDALEDVEVRWTVEPAGAATLGAAQDDPRQASFTLETTGTAVFTGCVLPPNEAVEPSLCDTVMVRVDDGMPSLELETPAPGAELDDPEGIVVRGSVADRGVVRVFVNGEPAEVGAMGQFELTLPARFGVNHLVVDASDGLTEPSRVEMDVLWAPAYTPATSEAGLPALTLQDGLALRLGQGFFDDGTPLDPSATPITTQDLADLLELVVRHVDVEGLVPDPVVDNAPTFTLRVRSVSLGTPHAELDLIDDGAELFLRISDVTAETSGVLMVEGASLPLTGTIRASAAAYAHLTIRKEGEDSEVEVTVGELVVGIESLEGSFASEETAAVFRLAEGLFRSTLEDTLSDAVRETVESSVPAVLRDALVAIDQALASQSIDLDSEPFPPVTIALDGRMASLDTSYRRDMLATLRTTIGTDVATLHPESRGVARLDPSPMSPGFFRDGSIALGVRLAVLNGLLHSLWSSGLLEVDATPLLPESITGLVSGAQLSGKIAPVLRPAEGEETDDLVLSLGQLELQLAFRGEPARFAVSVDAGVSVEVADNRIALSISETPRIHVWTLVESSDPRLLNATTVRTLLAQLWPDLRASVADGLAFELPLPALGDLGGLAPELAELTFQLESTERVYLRGGVLILDARLVGRLP